MGISPSLRGFVIGILIECFFVALGGGGAQGLTFGRFSPGSLAAFAGKVAAGGTVWFCNFFCNRRGQGVQPHPLASSTSSTSHRRDWKVETAIALQILVAHTNVAHHI